MPKNPRKGKHLNALAPGFELHWYGFRDILGQGGFGITYLAFDRNLAHEVAIKEYMPVDLASRASDNSVVAISPEHEERYQWGLERFIEEARTLAQFEHPNNEEPQVQSASLSQSLDTLASLQANAEMGDTDAQATLAYMYAKRIEIEKNDLTAAKWYQMAAEQGHVNSQYNLGVIYAKGRSLKQSFEKAFKWYTRAAEAGDPNAQYNLSVIYSKGRGIKPNIIEAKKWYKNSSDQGNENAGMALERLGE